MSTNATPLLDQLSGSNTSPKETAPEVKEQAKNNNEVAKEDGIKSEENVVYTGGCQSFLFFKYSLVWSIINLGIFLNKLYEDSATTSTYFEEDEINYFVVSALCLILPAVMYTIYLLGLYLKNEEGSFKCSRFGTLIVEGLLLIPWQVKSHVDVLHYLTPRVCRNKTSKEEKLDIKEFERRASKLDFFENFYAGLLQLLLQTYIILVSLKNNESHKTLIKCIVASTLSLAMTIRAAVRRKDDGPLSFVLSLFGWCLIFTSKVIAMAMAASVIHHYAAVFCGIHAIIMSFWITYLASQSHSQDEASGPLTLRKQFGTFLMVFVLFGVPSLWYWPIMFQLKQRRRHLIFFAIIFIENVILFALWCISKVNKEWVQYEIILVVVLFGSCLLGIIFTQLYICWKPYLTDQLVMYDMKVLNTDSYGLYFEFCDDIFVLPKNVSSSKTEKSSDIPTAAGVI